MSGDALAVLFIGANTVDICRVRGISDEILRDRFGPGSHPLAALAAPAGCVVWECAACSEVDASPEGLASCAKCGGYVGTLKVLAAAPAVSGAQHAPATWQEAEAMAPAPVSDPAPAVATITRKQVAQMAALNNRCQAAEQRAEALAGQINRALAILGPSVPASVTDEGARWEWTAALGTLTGPTTPEGA